MNRPLAGLRVLDLTNVLAGPFCCHQLAHLGAEVIKVETPGSGDLARQLGADPELNAKHMGVSFLAQNAGKRSITLNLKATQGRAALMKLVATADALVENFRPGVMARLKCDYAALKAVRPDLVYCAISGFGQDGPWAHRPAYDQIVQGASGAMAMTGDAQTAPLRIGFPVADTVGGLTAAMAIAAALNARPRGCFIDVSMLEALIATMGWAVSNWLIAGQRPTPQGNENATSAPSGAFMAADGPLNIAANKEEQWRALAKHLDREDLPARPEFATREARKKNRLALKAELEKTLSRKGARDWARELNGLGVPAGAIFDLPGILAHDVIRSRGMIARFGDAPGVGRPIEALRTGLKIDGQAPSVETPPPPLGADTDAILAELGYAPGEIAALRETGAI